uniref:Variant surface glycoprotein 1125.1564 n=1 Tax=Trypanosoma brucei TaxID=5691 RepID=A0A1J0R7L4_9TRYP|nr:variant surface glycoprotein 1125.1564 [Trypanosoma brucei]
MQPRDAFKPAKAMSNFKTRLMLFLCGIISVVTAENDDEKTANDAATDYCTLVVYYQSLEDELNTWLNDAAAKAQTLAAQTKLYTLAAAYYSGTAKAAGYSLLKTLTEQRASEAAAALKAGTPAITAAIAAIATKATEAKFLEAIRSTTVQNNGLTHKAESGTNELLTTSTPTGKCQATAAPKPKYSTDCKSATSKKTDIQKVKNALGGLSKLKTIKAKKVSISTITINIEGAGNIANSAGNWKVGSPATHCASNGGAATTTDSETNGLAVKKARTGSHT